MIDARLVKNFPARRDAASFRLDVELKSAAGVSVLFGPSGSGKTLTLDLIAGFLKPDAGRIMLDEDILYDADTRVHRPPQARRCGYVFQNYALFPHMTLRENLEFAATRWPRLERHRRMTDMLDRFRLGEVAGRYPAELSGGQKQRGSIARALVGQPRLLLLDEPARGLDAPLREELYDTLRQVRAQFETPVLLVTHDLEECFALGDELFMIHHGRVIQRGAPVAVHAEPASAEVARMLGSFNLLPVEIILLDPGRNRSLVRWNEHEIEGPYFPKHLKGDRVWLCVRRADLKALPRDGKPKQNQLPLKRTRIVEQPRGWNIEFEGGVIVEAARGSVPPATVDWIVEFPPNRLRVLS